MQYLEIRGVSKRFNDVFAVRSSDLAAAKGSVTVILGPSGCGKSTLLRLVAGLETPDEGRIYLSDRDITEAEPADRNIAMVFQDYALYPHMTAEKNMTFGLIMRGIPRRDAKERAVRAARLLGIEGLLKRKPATLSGGERQRVALGRAIVKEPSLFLMDEPLSNVDARFKTSMRFEIGRIIRDLGGTMIWVTHDQVEAMSMADTLAVMRDGTIEAVGSPRQLYERPPDLFVAEFLGSPSINIIPGDSPLGRRLYDENRAGAADACVVGVRPEAIRIEAGGGHTGVVRYSERLGFESLITVETGTDAGQVSLVVRITGEPPPMGHEVRFSIDGSRLHFFDRAGGKRIER